jgi:large subunit ribosomal protein L25
MSFRTVKAFRLRELALASKFKDGAPATGNPIQLPNPFLPHKSPLTGRWAPPKYSLRQQADLFKSAKASNLTHLLPFGPKSTDTPLNGLPVEPVSTEWWQARVAWKDSKPIVEKREEKEDPSLEGAVRKVTPRIKVKQMKGLAALKMYAGRKRMFKGHKWERVQAQRKKRTQILMRDMDKRITRYKEVHTDLVELGRVETHDLPLVVPSSQAQATLATKGCQSSQATVLKLIHLIIYPTNATHPRALAFGMLSVRIPPSKK